VELSLAGTVFDAQGQPVGQATVELYEGRYDPVAWMRFRLAGSAITDMMGKYAIISRVGTLPLAQCVVIARKDGLAMDWNGAALDAPRQIEMPFQLGPQGRLAGVVVDEKDQPLAGVTLRPLIQARFGPAAKQLVGLPALDFLAQRTDAEGHFEFTGLPATASAEFLLEGPGRARMTTLPSSPEDQHQAYKAGTSDVRIVSLPAASVSGRIVDEQGQGIGGLTLAGAPASMAGPLEMVWTLTGADGRYRLEGLRPVAYSIGLTGPATGMGEWAVKTGDLKPETGQAVENFDFTATKGGVLEVVIRRGETPAPKVYFRLAGVGVVAPLLAMTDEEGRYLLRAAPGMWKVLGVLLPDYVPIEQPPAVSVEANSTIQSVVILERRPQIAGTVLDDHGKPVGGAVVQLLHLPAQVGTDPNGHFEFDFVASRLDEQYKDQRAVYVRADDLVAARILKDSDRAPLELKLSPGLMAQGRVMDPNGAPVHGAPIDVMAFGQQWNHPMGTLATTDAQGRYSIAHLAAGLRYRLAPIAPGFGQMPAGITTSSEQTGTVDVAPIVLPPANLTISGTVVDVDGAGVPKADVAVYGQYIVPERKSQADEQGHFTVDGLTAGPLIVSASAQINGQTWHGRSEAAGGQKDVEVTLQNPSGLNRPKPNPQIGKPLGDLSVFSPLPAPGAMEGKRVLVCFWSLLHSGAVDALRDLSKRSEELRTQGIVIVTVLTSDERRMVVDRWLSQNGISLPLGRLPADPRQSRALLRQWNVGDMPWLLLTDENHIVRAESNDLDTLLGTPKKPASMPAGFGSGPEFPGRPQTAPTSMPNR
jgi:protocatechuate 3,4-dioxygenase beta subunit